MACRGTPKAGSTHTNMFTEGTPTAGSEEPARSNPPDVQDEPLNTSSTNPNNEAVATANGAVSENPQDTATTTDITYESPQSVTSTNDAAVENSQDVIDSNSVVDENPQDPDNEQDLDITLSQVRKVIDRHKTQPSKLRGLLNLLHPNATLQHLEEIESNIAAMVSVAKNTEALLGRSIRPDYPMLANIQLAVREYISEIFLLEETKNYVVEVLGKRAAMKKLCKKVVQEKANFLEALQLNMQVLGACVRPAKTVQQKPSINAQVPDMHAGRVVDTKGGPDTSLLYPEAQPAVQGPDDRVRDDNSNTEGSDKIDHVRSGRSNPANVMDDDQPQQHIRTHVEAQSQKLDQAARVLTPFQRKLQQADVQVGPRLSTPMAPQDVLGPTPNPLGGLVNAGVGVVSAKAAATDPTAASLKVAQDALVVNATAGSLNAGMGAASAISSCIATDVNRGNSWWTREEAKQKEKGKGPALANDHDGGNLSTVTITMSRTELIQFFIQSPQLSQLVQAAIQQELRKFLPPDQPGPPATITRRSDRPLPDHHDEPCGSSNHRRGSADGSGAGDTVGSVLRTEPGPYILQPPAAAHRRDSQPLFSRAHPLARSSSWQHFRHDGNTNLELLVRASEPALAEMDVPIQPADETVQDVLEEFEALSGSGDAEAEMPIAEQVPKTYAAASEDTPLIGSTNVVAEGLQDGEFEIPAAAASMQTVEESVDNMYNRGSANSAHPPTQPRDNVDELNSLQIYHDATADFPSQASSALTSTLIGLSLAQDLVNPEDDVQQDAGAEHMEDEVQSAAPASQEVAHGVDFEAISNIPDDAENQTVPDLMTAGSTGDFTSPRALSLTTESAGMQEMADLVTSPAKIKLKGTQDFHVQMAGTSFNGIKDPHFMDA